MRIHLAVSCPAQLEVTWPMAVLGLGVIGLVALLLCLLFMIWERS